MFLVGNFIFFSDLAGGGLTGSEWRGDNQMLASQKLVVIINDN